MFVKPFVVNFARSLCLWARQPGQRSCNILELGWGGMTTFLAGAHMIDATQDVFIGCFCFSLNVPNLVPVLSRYSHDTFTILSRYSRNTAPTKCSHGVISCKINLRYERCLPGNRKKQLFAKIAILSLFSAKRFDEHAFLQEVYRSRRDADHYHL